MPNRDTGAKAARRRYAEAFKRELVERSLLPRASVSAIALEHGINANVLFKWRREHLREASRIEPQRMPGQAVLLPVKVSPAQEGMPARMAAKPTTTTLSAGVIEIEMSGARVRVRGAVEEAHLRCVLHALRGLA